MHPTDNLASLAGLAVARAAAAGTGSGAGPRVPPQPAEPKRHIFYDFIVTAGPLTLGGVHSSKLAIISTKASTGNRMVADFAQAYADHHAARGGAVKVFRADGTVETLCK